MQKSTIQPALSPVPAFHHEMTIKATHAGIVLLREGRFKQRYLGSKTAHVDINGKLWLKKSDFKKANAQPGAVVRKKNGPAPANRPETIANQVGHEDTKNIGITKNYTVNKVEVRNRLYGMINTAKGKKEMYFWTISFPKNIPDDLAYKAFNTWLTTLRMKKLLRNYLWVAERQQNGTVHFHIAIPHRLNVVVANRTMRTTLCTFCKNDLLPGYSVFQAKRYNGVDIAKHRKTGRVTNFAIKKGARSLITYLTKYVTKNDASFSHLAWHNSRGFSALFTGISCTVQEFVRVGFDKLLNRKAVIKNEWFMFFAWRDGPPGALVQHLSELNDYVDYQFQLSNSKFTKYIS